jgi:hypothetical protein
MKPNPTNDKNTDWLQIVRRHIEPLNYGSVEIVIHDSRIVQIDTTQRWRLPEAPPVPRRETL